ncbi:MAG: hypothetical protein ACLQDF_11730 [Desulfomonilia bacterium]
METWKLPPKAKIYEAMSAVADNRIKITGTTSAEVISSSHDKTYIVVWSEDLSRITSNDNASCWQGYLGYPIVAVLMMRGNITFDSRIAEHLKGIPWKDINKRFRNDYEKAVDSVLSSLEERGVDTRILTAEIERIMAQLGHLSLKKLPKGAQPPKKRYD